MNSPLSILTNSSGKKRLILDLHYVNKHLWKQSISLRLENISELCQSRFILLFLSVSHKSMA